MQLAALVLAAALAFASTTAFAMGGGGSGSGGGSGVGGTYTRNPAECGGLVCFAKPPSASTGRDPRRARLRDASARLRQSTTTGASR